MKVYSCPEHLPAPEPDYNNYNMAREEAREKEHQKGLVQWLKEAGYTGKNTGGIASFPFADGMAQYMLAEGSKSCLILLPYGDAYQYPLVDRLTKAEILKNIAQGKRLEEMFSAAENEAEAVPKI